MTRVDIVDKIHKEVGFSRREIKTIMDSTFDIIKQTLQREDKIVISGFGNFIIRNKKPRRGRNPQTGGDLEISARRILTFKPSLIIKANLKTSQKTNGSDQERV
jgi:integration host factor subunit alpha